jgi:uncharacterized protein YpmB
MKSSAKQASQGQIVSAFVAIAVIVGATAFAWYWMQRQAVPTSESEAQQMVGAEPTPLPTPTPTPTKLVHGKDTYYVSGGGDNGPRVSEVTFDPLDPAVGGTQVISVKISDTTAVTSAQITMRTDTKTTPIQLHLVNGTDLAGVWEGKWIVSESYLYNYIPTVVAESSRGKTSIPITIRERK